MDLMAYNVQMVIIFKNTQDQMSILLIAILFIIRHSGLSKESVRLLYY